MPATPRRGPTVLATRRGLAWAPLATLVVLVSAPAVGAESTVLATAEKSVLSVTPCPVHLPAGTLTRAYGTAAPVAGSGRPITLGGPSALRPTDPFFAVSRSIRVALELFADHVNRVRGGIRVGPQLHPLHLLFVGEGPSPGEQITNATAHATQCHGVDFVAGGLCVHDMSARF